MDLRSGPDLIHTGKPAPSFIVRPGNCVDAGHDVELRALLHYHCGVRVFKTRQLMLDVQAMRRLPELDALPNPPL